MEKYIITIARGYGSGGKTVGKILAQRLNISYYNRDILQKAADESGINEAFFAKADEKTSRGFSKLFAKKGSDGKLIPPTSSSFVSEKNLFNYQSKVIKDLAEKGSCVIVGRCADYVLRDMPNVARIYIHAPFEACIKKVMQTDGITQDEAKKRIKAIDKQRSEYYTLYTGQDWRNAEHYDLAVNTENLSFEQCADLICKYLELRFN